MLQLGVNLIGRDAAHTLEVAKRAESLGYDSLWRGEAYGGDAVVPLAMAAVVAQRIKLGTSILQMAARTPAMTAMTAIHLDQMSGGRAVLGLGLSGPQVVEGRHGVPYTAPLQTTEEYVAIVRQIFEGGERVEYSGERYRIPYDGEGSTGFGKVLRPRLHTRADIPVFLAAIGPRNVALAARIADGLLPLLWSPTRWRDPLGDALDGVDLGQFHVAATVPVAVGPDVKECRDSLRPFLGHYIGGMGRRGATSITQRCGDTGMRLRRKKCRSSTCRETAEGRSPRYQTRSSTSSPWSGPRSGSSRHSKRGARRVCVRSWSQIPVPLR